MKFWLGQKSKNNECFQNVWSNISKNNDTKKALAEKILNHYPPPLCPHEASAENSKRINLILDGSESISEDNFEKMGKLSQKILSRERSFEIFHIITLTLTPADDL